MSIRGFWARVFQRAPDPEPRAQPTVQPAVPTAAPAPAQSPARREPRKVIATHILAHKFVRWMQAQGCSGYWLVDEIDELREAFCDRFGYQVPLPVEFRSCLAVTPGVTKGVYRLNAWELQEVKKRTHMERPTLYRIPDKMVRDTISSDFHAQVARCRQDDVACQSSDVACRKSAGKQVAKNVKRRQLPQKMVLKSTEIEAERMAA